MKKLPLGTQTFRDIIEKNQLYVDKTHHIYNFFEHESKFFFLSRPRRSGKSLLITTLKELFLGNKELFKGLWIYDKIEFKKYPVIHIDFLGMNYSKGSELFESTFFDEIKKIAESYNITLELNNYKSAFRELIEKLSKTEKVVILVDEYDKPITEHVDNIPLAIENRKILKGFYEVIKESDEHIKFAFLTGVSKFAKISVFSVLNNLIDITFSEKFSTITGYTEKELYSYFDEYIKEISNKLNVNEQELKKALKTWYNGYSWDGINFVYNPFSILNIFFHQQINNYWFSSGTPTFLLKMIREYDVDVKKLENYETGSHIFESYDIDNMNFESLLFQTGYLTIKKIQQYSITDRIYVLDYPNMEVKESLLRNILNDMINPRKDNEVLIGKLVRSLSSNNIDSFFDEIKVLFSAIPNHLFIKDKEAYYHTIIYLTLTLIGVRIKVEVHTNKGRIDAVIQTDNHIYILEFKLGSASTALKQIEKMNYHEQYLLSNKQITLIGIGFDVEERNIKKYLLKHIN